MDMEEKAVEDLLETGLIELGYTPSDSQINAFLNYLSELKKWNRAYNLTGIRKDEEIVIKHFLDSLLYLKAIQAGKVSIIDVGSGAGFPGIPIKIIRTEITLFLAEPSRKKSEFLRHIIKRLHLDNIEVIEKRIEDIRVGQQLAEPVDIAVTRALFTIKGFKNKASHIVKKGGLLILNKGPKVLEETGKLKDTEYQIITLNLPLTEIKRHLVVVNL